jgi:hypothetical protein
MADERSVEGWCEDEGHPAQFCECMLRSELRVERERAERYGLELAKIAGVPSWLAGEPQRIARAALSADVKKES